MWPILYAVLLPTGPLETAGKSLAVVAVIAAAIMAVIAAFSGAISRVIKITICVVIGLGLLGAAATAASTGESIWNNGLKTLLPSP